MEDVTRVDVAALTAERDLWHQRAVKQAARYALMAQGLLDSEISDSALVTRLIQECDGDRTDILWCEICGKEGWPEDGWVRASDDMGVRVDFCPEHR